MTTSVFEDDTLLQRRTNQRQFTRLIPDDLFRELVGEMTLRRAFENPLAEPFLRHEIMELIETNDISVRLVGHGEVNAMSDVYGWLGQSVVGLAPFADERRKALFVQEDPLGQLDAAEKYWLSSVLALLLLADELANDGYQDPRLA